MLAAVNSFFTYLGQEEWKVRLYKIQRAVYSKPEREMTKADYKRLVCAARKEGDMRMSMLIPVSYTHLNGDNQTPQCMQDKHFLRKHGPNAYYGQGKE